MIRRVIELIGVVSERVMLLLYDGVDCSTTKPTETHYYDEILH